MEQKSRMEFAVSRQAGAARSGLLKLHHAETPTPVFMPVGTQGAVKAMTPAEVAGIGYRLILGNTYHLHLRPGADLIAAAGGLHRFTGWEGALLTDSGGFQVFSLSDLRKIGPDGARFQSHIDGSTHEFTPERVMQIQRQLGADIVMTFDECAPCGAGRPAIEQAMERTYCWAMRCRDAWNEAGRRAAGGWPQALFGIVQGGTYPDLRAQSARALAAMDLPGYAIGGLAVGETTPERNTAIEAAVSQLPEERPRYLMGVGTPLDILDAVARGVDMFDCVLPTRNARSAQVFTAQGPRNLRNARYAEDLGPIEEGCDCEACAHHSRAYVRHLFRANEILGPRLATYHNLAFYYRLMAGIRSAIAERRLELFDAKFRMEYAGAGQEPEEQ